MNPPTLTIRRSSPKDAAAFARMLGDPEVLPNLMQVPYPSEERWHAILTENTQAGKRDMVLVAERDGEIVGNAGLHPTGAALRRQHVMTLGISVSPKAQGQGVGRALMQALCDYADRWAQVLRIELTVYADNARAIALYRKFGFEHEGNMKAYAMRDGLYVDAIAMARQHPNP